MSDTANRETFLALCKRLDKSMRELNRKWFELDQDDRRILELDHSHLNRVMDKNPFLDAYYLESQRGKFIKWLEEAERRHEAFTEESQCTICGDTSHLHYAAEFEKEYFWEQENGFHVELLCGDCSETISDLRNLREVNQ